MTVAPHASSDVLVVLTQTGPGEPRALDDVRTQLRQAIGLLGDSEMRGRPHRKVTA